jgi:hypothetical protein
MTQSSAPLKSVFVTTVATSTVAVIYGLLGVHPSPLPALIMAFAPLISVIVWVQSDARFHRFATIQDLGLFVYLLWPVVLPWYVIKTRGARAWTLALLLVGAVFAPRVFALAGALWHDVARVVLGYLRVSV